MYCGEGSELMFRFRTRHALYIAEARYNEFMSSIFRSGPGEKETARDIIFIVQRCQHFGNKSREFMDNWQSAEAGE
jgi:hypothetical protein